MSDLFYASQIVDGSPNSVEERVLEFIDVSAGRVSFGFFLLVLRTRSVTAVLSMLPRQKQLFSWLPKFRQRIEGPSG